MNVGELLTRARNRLNDAVKGTGSDSFWSDYELIDDYANAARDRMFQACKRLIVDSSTALDASGLPLCRIPIVAGTATYQLSTKIIGINRFKLISQTSPIQPITVDVMDAYGYDWQDGSTGAPTNYIVDLNTDAITLYPTPSANDTAYLTVCRYPLARLTAQTKSQSLEFREEYHEDLIPGILFRAYSKQDSEIYNPRKAQEQLALFESRCEEIRLETYRRSTTVTNTISMGAFTSSGRL